MNGAERHRRSMDIFDALCDIPSDQREAMLDEQCAGDAELRRKVESMVLQDGAADDFLQTAESGRMVAELAAQLVVEPAHEEALPARIGPYRVIRKIGEGGMGVVYEAEQDHPHRRVALKVLAGGGTHPQLLKRFHREANALGRLHHAGIARVYEAGVAEVKTDSGVGVEQPFFAMELVDGELLDAYARKHDLDHRARLELFTKICDAVQHAHEHGVIHRDLKPGNILVEPDGQPKVLDFGVSRATNADMQTVTLQTNIGQLIGTVPYMSPEQCAGDPKRLDSRSDVYSLGVVLFELLVDRLPYELKDRPIPEAVRIIQEQDPSRLSSIDRTFRGDIETIVGKALEKEKERRYQSAAQLAADIRHYLSDEPLVARPASTFYQMGKFARRNRILVGGVAATFVALLLGLAGTMHFLFESTRREEALRQRAAELETLSAFQQAQLEDIDLARMGEHLREYLLGVKRAELLAGGVEDGEVDAQVAMLDEHLSSMNLTSVSKQLVWGEIFDKAVRDAKERLSDQPDVQVRILEQIAQAAGTAVRAHLVIPIYEDALAICEESYGPDHTTTLRVLHSLGLAYIYAGRPEEATEYYSRAHEGRTRLLGSEHPDTLDSKYELRYSRGLVSTAEQIQKLSTNFEENTRTLGPGHRTTLESLLWLANEMLADRPAEAESCLRPNLEIAIQALGEDDKLTLELKSHLANARSNQGDHEEALRLHRSVLETRRITLGDVHALTCFSLLRVCGELLHLQRFDEVERTAVEGLAYMRAGAIHKGHWYGKFLRFRGAGQTGLGRFEDARESFHEALQALEDAHRRGDNFWASTERRRVMGSMAILYDAWHEAEPEAGHDIEAAKWRAKLEADEASQD